MAAFWFFNDGISTVIVMATIYGAGIGIDTSALILALLLTQFTGLPATLLFGRMVARFGARPMLMGSLAVYLLIVLLGYFMQTELHFFALAFLVGLVQGGSQSAARSLYAGLLPEGAFPGMVRLSGSVQQVHVILGPLVFSIVGTLTGSSRLAILAVAAFFLIGMVLLSMVDFQRGARQAESGGDMDSGPCGRWEPWAKICE